MQARAQNTFERAKRLVQQQRYAEALELLDRHADLLPHDDGQLVYVRARCLAHLGRFDEALDLCDRLIQDFGDPRGKKLAAKLMPQQHGVRADVSEHTVDIVPFLREEREGKTSPRSRFSRLAFLPRLRAIPRRMGVWAWAMVVSLGMAGVVCGLVLSVALHHRQSGPVVVAEPVSQPVSASPSAATSDPSSAPTPTDAVPVVASQTSDPQSATAEADPAEADPAEEESVEQAAAGAAAQPAPASAEPGAAQASAPTPSPAPSGKGPDLRGWTPPAAPTFPEGPVDDVVGLQPFRVAQVLKNERGDQVELVNLNPYVGAWFLLTLNVGDTKRVLHLEVLSKQGDPRRKPSLRLYRDGLTVAIKGWGARYFPLWSADSEQTVAVDAGKEGEVAANPALSTDSLNPAPVLKGVLAPEHSFGSPFTFVCDGFVLIRTQRSGSTTKLEAATDLLRQTSLGDWFVEQAKPYLIPAPDVGEDFQAEAAPSHQSGVIAPLDAKVEQTLSNLYCSPSKLGIETDAPDKRYFYGRWYKAVNHPDVFVSVMKPNVVDKNILNSYTDRVAAIGSHDRKRSEAEAMVYLAAYDLTHFKFGYAMGADHPKVDWSPRVPKNDRKGPGPDGFGNKRPLCAIGSVPPYHANIVEATFTGGFKREHGAFKVGPYSEVNNGSHFGFMEQGVVFSWLQPGLASLVITHNGSIHMMTWPEDGGKLLTKVTSVRQNCLPIIEGRDDEGFSVPGAYVNKWGPGCWSGDQDGDFLTLRAGVALQESPQGRFLIYAYFTGATPSTMARIFQSLQCRYAMLLDMNTPTYCFSALYSRDKDGNLTGAEYLNKDMAIGNGDNGTLKFMQTNDTRDFFYVIRKDPA